MTFRKIYLLLIVFITIQSTSCSTRRENGSNSIFPDSLFKYANKKFVVDDSLNKDYNINSRRFDLQSLSSKERQLITDPFFGTNSMYAAYFYSTQNSVKGITPILVLVSADDYLSVNLFLISGDAKVTSRIELTAGSCDVVNQTDKTEIVGCHQRDSRFLNDSTIRITDLNTTVDGYGKKDAITTTDSISMDYRIDISGLLKEIRRDSVRYISSKTFK